MAMRYVQSAKDVERLIDNMPDKQDSGIIVCYMCHQCCCMSIDRSVLYAQIAERSNQDPRNRDEACE